MDVSKYPFACTYPSKSSRSLSTSVLSTNNPLTFLVCTFSGNTQEHTVLNVLQLTVRNLMMEVNTGVAI